MNILQVIVLGIIEGITEFLPVSSTGHLTIAEKLFNLKIDDPGIVAFTAIIQVGAIIAAIIYFWKDIVRIARAWFIGLADPKARSNHDYYMGWNVIVGSIPIAVVGLVFKKQIETNLRSLWIVAIALIAWSFVLWIADRVAKQKKGEKNFSIRDAFFMGVAQCFALIPGVSRSGATISAGLFKGYDRYSSAKLSFYLGIPALVAAGALESISQAHNISIGVGWGNTIIGIIISFVVAYFSIDWLMKFISKHNYGVFILYRIMAGLAIIGLLASGVILAV